jgi:signal transduction histidine kinase
MFVADELREYLRRVASSSVRQIPDSLYDGSTPQYRKHLLSRLEDLEQQLGPARIAELHAEWTNADRLASFVRAVTADHLERFGRDTSIQSIQDLIRSAIDLKLGLPVNGSLAWKLELQGAVERGWSTSNSLFRSMRWDVERYALEIHAVRSGHDLRIAPTPIGRVTLELTGSNLVRWLLHVEAEQSMGLHDPWRLSRSVAGLLAVQARDTVFESDPSALAVSTLYRLWGMGLLEELDFDIERAGRWTYLVRDEAIPILEEIASSAETPLRVLAATLLGDERNASLAKAQPTLAQLFGEEAAAAGIRQARLVAHEVRNSLVPVQVALEGLFQILDRASVDGVDRYRSRIDDGVDRVFKFVDETLRMLTIVAEPAEAFDVSSALGDAVGSFAAGEAEVTRNVQAPGDLPPIVGVRSRFVLAMGNLVRNAIQSTSGRKPVITLGAMMAPDARSIMVTVDDDGPGVPADQREAIFGRGVSLRPGGTGMGLALTREVVEKELGGKVSCTESPLGGARFEVVLPVAGKGAS